MSTMLRYLGFAGFEITTEEDYRIVIDPFLSGDADQGVPPSPVAIETLDNTNLVLVSHGAPDHVGEAFEIVHRSGALLACGPEVRLHAIEQGIPEEQIAFLLSGYALNLKGTTVKVLDVRHVSLLQSNGQWIAGQPLSFMLRLSSGLTIYHSGDTSLFGDLKLYGELHQPDVVLLCVGGIKLHGFELVPLPPDEAALALEWLGARLAIPMHYRPESNAAGDFKAIVTARQIADVRIMEPAEVINLDDYA